MLLSSIGLVLAASILIGYLGGTFLDTKLGTEPWFMLVGLLIGIVAGFTQLFRTVRSAGSPDGGKRRGDGGGGGSGSGGPGGHG